MPIPTEAPASAIVEATICADVCCLVVCVVVRQARFVESKVFGDGELLIGGDWYIDYKTAGGGEKLGAGAEIGLHCGLGVVDCLVGVQTCSADVQDPGTGGEGRAVNCGVGA
jgi:hypothetical protein